MKTDQLITALVQDLPTPAVRVSDTLRRALPIAAVVMASGFLLLVGVRADLLSTGIRPTAIKLAFGALLAVFGIATAVRLSRPEAAPTTPLAGLVAVPLFVLAVVAIDLGTYGTAEWAPRMLGHSLFVCLTVIPALAIVPLIGVLHAIRQGAATHLTLAGAWAGLGSAGISILAYGLFCSEDSALFVAAWYLLASFVAGAIGALVGRRVLRW